jgi:hypothetical protein
MYNIFWHLDYMQENEGDSKIILNNAKLKQIIDEVVSTAMLHILVITMKMLTEK